MQRPWLLLVVFSALLLDACGSAASTSVTASINAKAIPAISLPAWVPGPLDGIPTPRARALRRPLGVVIENFDPDSRPQSGLASASTVIETLAEDGITRFLAIFLENDATKVGPVRSTRMYFNNMAAGWHLILTHVGGNDDAQRALWTMPKIFNIDENRWEKSLTDTGTPLFWRSADRVAPHNMYVSTFKLRSYAAQNHQNWAYSEAYLGHKKQAPLAQRGRMVSAQITFVNPLAPGPNPGYAVEYRFQRRTDTYLRLMGGAPHIDSNTGRSLSPSNVVIMHMKPASFDPLAGTTPQSIQFPVIGRGKAEFLIDGKIIYGTWSQPNVNAMVRYYDAHGKAIAFNPGQTWIEVLPSQCTVTYTRG